jgi:hypothetical protein
MSRHGGGKQRALREIADEAWQKCALNALVDTTSG